MMRRCGLFFIFWNCLVLAESRLLFISIDGLGYKNLTEDSAAKELTTLDRLIRKGRLAALQTSFPSKTSAGHAALFTGTWAGGNGIYSNTNPRLPRSAYALADTITGFRSESLTAEPIWAAAARQGVSSVAYQATQLYPFTGQSSGSAAVVNGYQTWMMAPHRAVRQKDLTDLGSRGFQWNDGPLVFKLERVAGGLRIWSGTESAPVVVKLHPLETASPRKRPLARRFSAMLPVAANGIRTGVYFRLFEYTDNDFLLYRTSAQELGSTGMSLDLIGSDGAFVGNSAVSLYERGMLGPRLVEGGDGTAERRYLETLELTVRQMSRHLRTLDSKLHPRLLVGYFPVIDDLEHAWFGWVSTGMASINPYRAWGYAALDEGLKPILKRFGNDSIIMSSDHGMAGNTHEIRMGTLLAELGFPKQSVLPNASCLFLNTSDWRNGIVPVADRENWILQLEAKLTSQGLFTRFYKGKELAERFGLSGEIAPDLCFDVRPMYYPTESSKGEAVSRYPHPRGEHGFDPTRSEMESYLIVSGKGVRPVAEKERFQAIDVASIATALLGIQPPAKARGTLPAGVLAAAK
jgi:hypothetical protein